MKLIGITGGIGMGKSTTTAQLRSLGVPVVESDCLARTLVEPGQPALAEIQAAFGAEVMGADGKLDRAGLAQKVFVQESARLQLEAILHPRIRAAWQAQAQTWRAEGLPAAAVDIPLLFETRAENEFDFTVCVACSAATQLSRLRARGWSDAEIARRVQAQWPIVQKMNAANYVVWNESSLAVCTAQLKRILRSETILSF